MQSNNRMNTDKFPFKKVFKNTGDAFSAEKAAGEWLKEKGLTWGTMQAPEPRGILKTETVVKLAGEGGYIPKWTHLSSEDRETLDGVATAEPRWRDGDVIIHLKSDPG